MSKLALGTVQFGLKYGIANKSGQVNFNEAAKIINHSRRLNINSLDTAISYGNSEDVLGRIGVKGFNVVSKLPAPPDNILDIHSWVQQQVERSLAKLGLQSLYGLLLHRSESLVCDSSEQLIDALFRVKSMGLVQKVGISIYDPSELTDCMHLMPIDLLQAPLNVIDRRLETSGWLTRLHQQGIEVHTRSTFLQGLLLMPRSEIPVKFEIWKNKWDSWISALEKFDISAATACLSYPLSLNEVDRIVVGVDNFKQLSALIEATKVQIPKQNFSFMSSDDKMLINPSNWSAL